MEHKRIVYLRGVDGTADTTQGTRYVHTLYGEKLRGVKSVTVRKIMIQLSSGSAGHVPVRVYPQSTMGASSGGAFASSSPYHAREMFYAFASTTYTDPTLQDLRLRVASNMTELTELVVWIGRADGASTAGVAVSGYYIELEVELE